MRRLYKNAPIPQKRDRSQRMERQGALTMMIIRSTGRISLSIIGAGVFAGRQGS